MFNGNVVEVDGNQGASSGKVATRAVLLLAWHVAELDTSRSTRNALLAESRTSGLSATGASHIATCSAHQPLP
jgi:hypothetical protein